MELPSQEAAHHDIAIPLSSTYGGHMMHHHQHHHGQHDHHVDPPAVVPHHHHHHHTVVPQIPPTSTINGSSMENDQNEGPGGFSSKKSSVVGPAVRYRECLKNHAAAMGGNATDGCGEFMPSGEEGSIEALTCSACSCHRNFHRKETEGDHNLFPYDQYCFNSNNNNNSNSNNPHLRVAGRKLFLGYPTATGTLIHSRPSPAVPQQMIMSYNMAAAAAGSHSLPSESDEQEDIGGLAVARPPQHHHQHHQMAKKRFRTKFTPEQKEKMLGFAEKVGWKIQKQEESVVQQFCQEIGVKRRVLKVWMHNNKHNLAKKNNNNNNNNLNNNNNTSHDHLLVSAAPNMTTNNINSSTTN